MNGHIRFDTGPLGNGTSFDHPLHVIRADTLAEVAPAFEAMQQALDAGHWLAGYTSYEMGYALVPRLHHLMPARAFAPLIQMGVFSGPSPARALPGFGDVRTGAPQPLWSRAEYDHAIGAVHDYIRAGDCYQINLTFPMTIEAQGDPLAIYAALRARQPVGEGAYVDLGGPVILSRSPELFFATDATRVITTRPMKGTRPRGATRHKDMAAVTELAQSEKDRAENLMIVDLLRNDISRVCKAGSVKVPSLFQIEHYATVHQMTSTVTGQLEDTAGLGEIFEALFPCGSITGAPKIRAMEIIAELETVPRGIYCGAIGWVDPAGPMRFNVAIRSPVMDGTGGLRLHVGGGIVYDSLADAEWDEAFCKAAYLALSPTG